MFSAQHSEFSVFPPRLVVFDIGRVLLRICNDWSEAARRGGIESPLPAIDPANLPLLQDACHRIDIGQMHIDDFVSSMSPIFRLTPKQLRAASDAYLVHAYPGGVELIEDLHARSIQTACLSNTNASHWELMNDPTAAAHIPPLHRLTYRFASHLVGLRKPDPAIYAHVERETAIAPSSILFFDDIPENIAAAQARGWQGFHVDPMLENPIPVIRDELRKRGAIPR